MNATPKVTFALLSLAAALSSAPLSAQDKFADIATARYQLRSTLVEPAPPDSRKSSCPWRTIRRLLSGRCIPSRPGLS